MYEISGGGGSFQRLADESHWLSGLGNSMFGKYYYALKLKTSTQNSAYVILDPIVRFWQDNLKVHGRLLFIFLQTVYENEEWEMYEDCPELWGITGRPAAWAGTTRLPQTALNVLGFL